MRDDLKLVQIFLTQNQSPGPSVYEVGLDEDNKVICTCPGYRGRSVCKHSKIVKQRMEDNEGVYPIQHWKNAPKEEIEKARLSNKNFREFIIKFGNIEVI